MDGGLLLEGVLLEGWVYFILSIFLFFWGGWWVLDGGVLLTSARLLNGIHFREYKFSLILQFFNKSAKCFISLFVTRENFFL